MTPPKNKLFFRPFRSAGRSCKDETARLCKDYSDDHLLDCLAKYARKDQFSAVAASWKSKQHKAFGDFSALPRRRMLFAGVPTGGVGSATKLGSHYLSVPCRTAVLRAKRRREHDYRLNPKVDTYCKEDIAYLCSMEKMKTMFTWTSSW